MNTHFLLSTRAIGLMLIVSLANLTASYITLQSAHEVRTLESKKSRDMTHAANRLDKLTKMLCGAFPDRCLKDRLKFPTD